MHQITQTDRQGQILDLGALQVTSSVVDGDEDFVWDDAGTLNTGTVGRNNEQTSDGYTDAVLYGVSDRNDDHYDNYGLHGSRPLFSPVAGGSRRYLAVTDARARRLSIRSLPPLSPPGQVVYSQTEVGLSPTGSGAEGDDETEQLYASLLRLQSRPLNSTVGFDESNMAAAVGPAPALPSRRYSQLLYAQSHSNPATVIDTSPTNDPSSLGKSNFSGRQPIAATKPVYSVARINSVGNAEAGNNSCDDITSFHEYSVAGE